MSQNTDFHNILTEEEENFCLLFVDGCDPYRGNASYCYHKTLGKKLADDDPLLEYKAKKLMARQEIKDFINQLQEEVYDHKVAVKARIENKLMKIMDECSEGEYYNRYGIRLSPAPLRSVALKAAKELGDLNGLHKLAKITEEEDGADSGASAGITFNVIVPDQPAKDTETDILEG